MTDTGDKPNSIPLEVTRVELAVLLTAVEYCAADDIRGTEPVIDLFAKLKQLRDQVFPPST